MGERPARSSHPRRCRCPDLKTITTMILVASMVLPGSAVAQDLEHRGQAVAWQYGMHIPAGEIRGLVLSENGDPLEHALVDVPHLGIRSMTGPDGAFRLSAVPPGPTQVRFRSMGHGTVSEEFLVPSDVGMHVVSILPLAMIGGRCGDLRWRGDGIYVDVVDVAKGRPPTVPVTVRLERGSDSWEQTSEIRPSEHGGTPLISLRYRIEEAGEYTIEVSAPGYVPWRLEGVDMEVELAVCDVTAANRRHSVQLVPVR